MNKRYSYTPIIIAVILLLSYSQGHYLFATQNSPVEEQTKNASNDEINKIQNREPTETRDGGEYSGFEETGVQTKGIPDKGAETTPEAPISGVKVKNLTDENVTTPSNATNAIGRSFNQSDTTAIANTTLQTNSNQAKQNSSNPIIDTLQKINPLK